MDDSSSLLLVWDDDHVEMDETLQWLGKFFSDSREVKLIEAKIFLSFVGIKFLTFRCPLICFGDFSLCSWVVL